MFEEIVGTCIVLLLRRGEIGVYVLRERYVHPRWGYLVNPLQECYDFCTGEQRFRAGPIVEWGIAPQQNPSFRQSLQVAFEDGRVVVVELVGS